MKAWGEKAKAGVWPARASLHLGLTLRSLNGGIPTLQFNGASNLTQAFLMDVFVSRTGPKKNALDRQKANVLTPKLDMSSWRWLHIFHMGLDIMIVPCFFVLSCG